MSQHAIENPLFQRIYTLKKGGVKYKIFFNKRENLVNKN